MSFKSLLIAAVLSFCYLATAYGQGGKMDQKEFWKVIDSSVVVAKGDQQLQAKTIVQLLSAYSPQEIIDFELVLRKTIIAADHFNVLAAEQIMDGMINDGLYLSFRCWLISQGQKVYEETMKDPQYLVPLVNMQTHSEFKELLYVSTEAYQIRTKQQKEDNTFPRNVAIANNLDLEFTDYPTKGVEWKEGDLPKMYPKLWAKFHKQ